jgi:hypothetical protein
VDEPGQVRQSFNQRDLQNNHNDFEKRYGKLVETDLKGDRQEYAQPTRKGEKGGRAGSEEVDENGRVNKGPVTLKNGATY